LLDLVDVVPAGVSELVKKQAEGWAYIRPYGQIKINLHN